MTDRRFLAYLVLIVAGMASLATSPVAQYVTKATSGHVSITPGAEATIDLHVAIDRTGASPGVPRQLAITVESGVWRERRHFVIEAMLRGPGIDSTSWNGTPAYWEIEDQDCPPSADCSYQIFVRSGNLPVSSVLVPYLVRVSATPVAQDDRLGVATSSVGAPMIPSVIGLFAAAAAGLSSALFQAVLSRASVRREASAIRAATLALAAGIGLAFAWTIAFSPQGIGNRGTWAIMLADALILAVLARRHISRLQYVAGSLAVGLPLLMASLTAVQAADAVEPWNVALLHALLGVQIGLATGRGWSFAPAVRRAVADGTVYSTTLTTILLLIALVVPAMIAAVRAGRYDPVPVALMVIAVLILLGYARWMRTQTIILQVLGVTIAVLSVMTLAIANYLDRFFPGDPVAPTPIEPTAAGILVAVLAVRLAWVARPRTGPGPRHAAEPEPWP